MTFFVAANVVEGLISGYLAGHDGRIGPLSLDAATAIHIQAKGDRDALVEFVWAIPTSICFFVGAAVPPREGWRLRWSAWLATLLGATAYSATRWVPDLTRSKMDEGNDFVAAIALATVAGLATGYARRRQA